MTGFRIKRCAHLQRRGCEWGRRWDKGLPFRLTVGNSGRSARSVKRHPGNCCGKKKKKKHSPAKPDQCVRLRCLALSVSLLSCFTFFCISSWGLINGASNICHRTIVETSWWGKKWEWDFLIYFLPIEYHESHSREAYWIRLLHSIAFFKMTLGTEVGCVNLRCSCRIVRTLR